MKMKNKVDITVGICVKNSEKTPIRETIESILNQTFPRERIEIIVVDDGCTDRTIPIIVDLLSKAKVSYYIYSTGGKGRSAARQMVVDNAHGKFVVWVDDDTVLLNSFFQEQFDIINKNPLIGAVQGKIGYWPTGSLVAKLEYLSMSRDYEFKFLKRDPKTLGTGSNMFRLSAIKKAGGFDRKIGRRAGEDTDITRRIKTLGYRLSLSQAESKHIFGLKNWKDLWSKYVYYGYGMHYLHRKHKNLISFMSRSLPVRFAEAIVCSLVAFKKTREIVSFLLPLFAVLKSAAWWFGFIKAHIKDRDKFLKRNYD